MPPAVPPIPTATLAADTLHYGGAWLQYGALGLLALFMTGLMLGAGWIARRWVEGNEDVMRALASAVRDLAGEARIQGDRATERHAAILASDAQTRAALTDEVRDLRADLGRLTR